MRVFHSGKSRYAAASMLAVVALVACSSGGSGGSGDSGSSGSSQPVLTIGVTENPLTFPGDNVTGGGQGNQAETTSTLDYAPLINLSPAGDTPTGLTPWLATSWGYIGTNYETFYMNLRQGVKFSNGQPFNAAAVKTWIEYVYHQQLGAWAADITDLKSVTTPNPYKVVIQLGVPNPSMPYIFAQRDSNYGLPACPAAVANPSITNDASCGAGPYEVQQSSTVTGNIYTFVPNPYYYDKSAQKWSKVVAKVISTPSSMLAALQTGEIEVAVGDSSTVAQAQSVSNVKVVEGFAAAWGLNLVKRAAGSSPLGNVLVRQALNYAVDRAAITNAVLGPGSQPTSQLYNLDGLSQQANNYYSYDPAKAKQLLAQAGYGNGLTISVLEVDLGDIGTTLGQAIASYWAKVGVTAQITSLPPTDVASVAADLKTGKYDATFLAAPSGPMQFGYKVTFVPGGSEDYLNVSDPQLDALYQTAVHAANPAPYWQQMNLTIAEQADVLPVGWGDNYYYVNSSKVAGVMAPDAREGLSFASEWYPASG